MPKILTCLAAMLLILAQASAQVLYAEDLEDGEAQGWIPDGRGDVRVTSYAGNSSLRLTRSACATIGLRVSGPPRVRISVSLAAEDLEGRDACLAETSVDGGQTYQVFHEIKDGADDAVTLYRGAVEAIPPLDDPLYIRVRIDGNGSNDTCWADDFQIAAVHSPNVAAAGNRSSLSAEFLKSDDALSRPVAMREFGPIFADISSAPTFEGRLSFSVAEGNGFYAPLRDRLNFGVDPVERLGYPPTFTVDLIASGNRLIPRNRSLQMTDHVAWDLILSAGKIWVESGDGGASRAALPFALQEKNANCTHNGVLTFLLRDGAPVSRGVYQISSETCAYHQFDMWGVGDVSLVASQIDDAEAIVAGYRRELARRLPTKPFSQLQADHPSLDASAFGSPQDISREHLTTFGVVVDGVHYKSACFTRYGDYPYCENMPLPSYSTSKSVFAGLGLMRLEQLFTGAKDRRISDYVDACDEAGWEGITFDHALDMATGRFRSKTPDADEGAAVRDGFFLTPLHQEKIQRACGIYPRREPPGRSFVYHTTDHYVLGSAMQVFLSRQIGPDADIHRTLIVDPLDRLLGLSQVAKATRRTGDAVGQPYVGWGLTFLSDDIAKIGDALSGSEPNAAMVQLFGAEELATALQQNPLDRGLPAPEGPLRYSNGFWSYDAASVLSCKASVPVPFMSGFGGISVVLMPNGVTYYYFSDNEEFAWARAVVAADRFEPICEAR